MSDDKPVYDVETARLLLEQDEQARIAEFNAIVEREARRLRVAVVAVAVLTQDGRIGAEARVVPQR